MSAKPLPATQKVEKIKERKRRLPLTGTELTQKEERLRERKWEVETAVKADRGMEDCRTGKTYSLFLFSDLLSQPI